MKRYLLFSGDNYYPGGGWEDFCGDFDTVEAAKAAKLDQHKRNDWYHVIDIETGREVAPNPAVERDLTKMEASNG